MKQLTILEIYKIPKIICTYELEFGEKNKRKARLDTYSPKKNQQKMKWEVSCVATIKNDIYYIITISVPNKFQIGSDHWIEMC